MSISHKAHSIRNMFEQVINDFEHEGRSDLAAQTTHAITDVPDDTMARLYDIVQSVMGQSVTVHISNVDLAALNNRLGNVSSVPLERAIMELIENALGPETDPHSGAVIEPGIAADIEVRKD